jgi:hypothetical protein
MVKLENNNNLDWILNNIDELMTGDDWKGNFISHLLPDRFEAYIKVLHTIYEDTSISDKEKTWNQTEKIKLEDFESELIKNLLSQATLTFGTPEGKFTGRRIKWKELAQKYNVPYLKTINVNSFIKHFSGNSFPRYLIGPAEGVLEKHEVDELISILTPYTKDSDCYFYYDSLVLGDPERNDFYIGKLSELIDLISNHSLTFGNSPTYFWPESKDWCLNTDYDLSFSVIGCNRQIANKLLSSDILETIEVDRMTRIDYKADEQYTPHNIV